MSSESWRQVGFRLGAEIILLLMLIATFFAVYILRFQEPAGSLWAHLGLLTSAWIGLAGARLILWAVMPPVRAVAWVSAALFAAAVAALFLYYALVLVGLYSWGRVVSSRLISTYSFQIVDLLHTVNDTGKFAFLAMAAMFAVGSGVFWVSLRIEWLGPLHQRLSKAMVWSLIVFAICIPALSFHGFRAVPPVKDREPFSLTFFPEVGAKPVQSNPFAGTLDLDRAAEAARAAVQISSNAKLGNVIVIVGDALRRDHMGLYGYERDTTPFLSHLDKLGRVTKAERMASVCAESSCGLFAIANSKFVHEFSDRAFGLPELLRRYGYRIHMVMGGDHTNFYGLRELYGAVDSYFDGASASGYYMNDDQLVLDKIRTLPPFDGKPVYLQIHLMSSHPLGTRQSRFLKFLPSENYATVLLQTGGPDPARTNFYDNGVLQLDDMVQQISGLLAEKGYLNRALVILTGDHGEMLGEHQEYSHAKSVYQSALDVPFVMVAYGDLAIEPCIHHQIASQVDIAPTIARALNIPAPAVWSGEALQSPGTRESIFFQQGAQVGLVDLSQSETMIKYWRNLKTGAEYAFDLIADEGEQVNLVETIAASKLSEWRLRILGPSAAVQVDLPDTQEVIHAKGSGCIGSGGYGCVGSDGNESTSTQLNQSPTSSTDSAAREK